MTRIPVPESAVRSPAVILQGMTVINETVWATCWHCNGTGNYPSSCTPPGRCRYYCWSNRTPETFGKLPYPVTQYVKKAQMADRANYRAGIRAEIRHQEELKRLEAVDVRIQNLAQAFSLDPKNLPSLTDDSQPWDYVTTKAQRNRNTAISLVGQWVGSGQLSEKQWTLVSRLPVMEQTRLERVAKEEAARAAREWIGTIGERIEVRGLVKRVSSFKSQGFRSYHTVTRYAVRLLTEEGFVVSWFADVPPVQLDQDGYVVGQPVITIRGTVKKHEEYKGEKQTLLMRVKVD